MSVLYVDHSGHPTPLSLSYHATASRHLSSGDTSSSSSPSIALEVDAVYCPQCLTAYDTYIAASTLMSGRCKSDLCRLCPLCNCPLSLKCEESSCITSRTNVDEKGGGGEQQKDDEVLCMYRCGYCHWTSEECGLVISLPLPPPASDSYSSDDTALSEVAAEKLGEKWRVMVNSPYSAARVNTGDDGASAGAGAPSMLSLLSTSSEKKADLDTTSKLFRKLCEGWDQKAQQHQLEKKLGRKELSAATAAALRVTPKNVVPGGGYRKDSGIIPFSSISPEDLWSVEKLEQNIKQKKVHMDNVAKAGVLMNGGVFDSRSVEWTKHIREGPVVEPMMEENGLVSNISYEQSIVQGEIRSQRITPTPPSIPSQPILLPNRIPLRARKSKRCRLELSRGKPGILVKPKMSPLEGDSSLRSGHGKWWKKDCSAVHVVPQVKILRYGTWQQRNIRKKKNDGDDEEHLQEETQNNSTAAMTIKDSKKNRSIHAILLQVHNPTHGLVRLHFSSSLSSSTVKQKKQQLQQQQHQHQQASEQPSQEETSSTITTNNGVFHNLLLDPYDDQQKRANVHVLRANSWKNTKTTTTTTKKGETELLVDENEFLSETIELDSVDDSLLEMRHHKPKAKKGEVGADGCSQDSILLSPREQANKWTADSAIRNFIQAGITSSEEEDITSSSFVSCSFRIIGKEADSAWLEVILNILNIQKGEKDEDKINSSPLANSARSYSSRRIHWGLPLSMKIEVGNGSWETPHIEPKKEKTATTTTTTNRADYYATKEKEEKEIEKEKDFVSFDLILVWSDDDASEGQNDEERTTTTTTRGSKEE